MQNKKINDILKIGDTVLWCGSFGLDTAKEAIVTDIDANCNGCKYGTSVDSIEWNEVTRENVVVVLDNGHWSYGNQISEIKV